MGEMSLELGLAVGRTKGQCLKANNSFQDLLKATADSKWYKKKKKRDPDPTPSSSRGQFQWSIGSVIAVVPLLSSQRSRQASNWIGETDLGEFDSTAAA